MDLPAVIQAVCDGEIAVVRTLTADCDNSELARCDNDGYSSLHYAAFFGGLFCLSTLVASLFSSLLSPPKEPPLSAPRVVSRCRVAYRQ